MSDQKKLEKEKAKAQKEAETGERMEVLIVAAHDRKRALEDAKADYKNGTITKAEYKELKKKIEADYTKAIQQQ